jgi:hypothetical protein
MCGCYNEKTFDKVKDVLHSINAYYRYWLEDEEAWIKRCQQSVRQVLTENSFDKRCVSFFLKFLN